MNLHVELAQFSQKTGKKKLYTVRHIEGEETFYCDHGVEGGKIRTDTTHCNAKNVGKASEISAADQARKEAEAKVKKKVKNGYRPADDVDAMEDSLVFVFDPLPSNVVPSKPSIKPPKGVNIEGGYEDYFAERKNNGVNIWKIRDLDSNPHIYTRGVKEITKLVWDIPEIKAWINTVEPNGTWLSAELIAYNKDGLEVPEVLRAIVNERSKKAKVDQRYDELIAEGYTFAIKVFDVLVWAETPQTEVDYADRRQILVDNVYNTNPEYRSVGFKALNPAIIEAALKADWEGFLLRKLRGPDSWVVFTMDGKPARKGSWKLVFERTADYFITAVKKGTSGRFIDKLANFQLSKVEDNGKIIECTWAGSGSLSAEELDDLTEDLMTANGMSLGDIEADGTETYLPVPLVVETKFRRVKPDTNALEFPVILRARPDKPAAECRMDDIPELYVEKQKGKAA